MQEAQSTGSAWPAPPNYYKRYTLENVQLLREAQKKGEFPDAPIQQPPLPEFYLQAMEPPPVPTDSYTVFDQKWQVQDRLPTLSELGVKQLFPAGPIDRIQELKKLNRALIVQFLDLLDVLVKNPEEFGSRIENISTIFINMHHILNEYRPHQARETLRLLMESQLAKKRQMTADLREKNEAMVQSLKQFSQETSQTLASIVTDPHTDLDNQTHQQDTSRINDEDVEMKNVTDDHDIPEADSIRAAIEAID
ncbi:MED7 protein-domain-containing protein [Radiomyces spectabilis]|uniref:MED7 protein-domain-containing protein n=1 Tax=Radiomyces spectabilis TaxID=64574 RepID=UPI002220DE50|nr:MED7 protein-domain-containing protein [Radiomyces spectabilis]KAI8374449.1 MED7 protein-domain-containing protein [Radiomyces spectabilis]